MELIKVDSNKSVNSRRKKLVFLSTRIFWPTDSGHKYEIYHYCRGLHDRYGYDIYVYCFCDQNQSVNNINDKPYFINEVKLAKSRSSFLKLMNIIRYSLLKQKWPLQCSLFYSKKNSDDIHKYVENIAPDVVLVDMIRLGMYYESILNIDCHKIINIEDCLSLRYERQSSSRSVGDFFGTYNLPKLASKALRPFGHHILRFESMLCKRFEKYCYDIFDYSIFVSGRETKYVNNLYGDNKAKTVTMGAADEFFDHDLEEDVVKTLNSAVFVGNCMFPANAESVDIIINDVLPYVKSDVVFTVIGKCPDYLRKRHKDNERVRFAGFVQDLSATILQNEVFLSPIAYGTGIKTKLIEALALGMPIITNSVGAEGIDVENGIHMIIEDDYRKIAQAFDRLIADAGLRRNLGENAEKLSREKYQWDTIWESFVELEL